MVSREEEAEESAVAMRHRLAILTLVLAVTLVPSTAPAVAPPSAPVAVFPLQELGAGRNEVNLPFTRLLTELLAGSGNDVSRHETVIAFMANNRVRTLGHLESFHISRVRDDLGAAFVLLGTVSQRKERPLPSLGLTLQLVRTSDARTVWSYVGHVSVGDERRALGIGEPRSVADLAGLLLDDILARWPWEIIGEVQQLGQVSIDAVVLHPAQVRPGGEVHARVRLRNVWLPGRAPRVFVKADDQLHAARVSADGSSYEASWIAGEKDGRFPVTLILEWPLYGRRETALLGSYLVDGTPPLFDIELRGIQLSQDTPVFRDELVIIPRPLVRKPLERWRLSFQDAAGSVIGADDGVGNLPERFVWQGRSGTGSRALEGTYEVILEAWDRTGNAAKASRTVEYNPALPAVALELSRSGDAATIALKPDSRVPLAYWRMEMWTRDGKFITRAEGEEVPAEVSIELPGGIEQTDLQGILVMRDALGGRARTRVEELLPRPTPPAAAKETKPAGISETWVEEF